MPPQLCLRAPLKSLAGEEVSELEPSPSLSTFQSDLAHTLFWDEYRPVVWGWVFTGVLPKYGYKQFISKGGQ